MNRRIARVFSAFIIIGLLLTLPRAQSSSTTTQPSSEDRIALYQALLDLTNPFTVMCVAAHPDDEDGTSLVVMRRKYGAHTVSLFSTFGEGGQNAIGSELYEQLGAIRVRETLAASEIQGSEPYFLGLRDFGFSKSRDETFQKWGHENALQRMVLHIRRLRPDVIITNHSTTSNDHGHHQATALLVVEAFDAAADPKRFPDQLKDGVTAWQVQRLFVRQRGNQPPPAEAQLVTIDPNERDPVRGTMFAEQALAALQKHASQGPWPATFAEFTARFRAFSGPGGATGQMPPIRYRLERQAKTSRDSIDRSTPIDAGLPKDSRSFLDGLRLPGDSAKEWPATINGRALTEFAGDREKLLEALIRLPSIGAVSRGANGSLSSDLTCFGSPPASVHDLDPRRDLLLERLSSAIKEAAGIRASLSAKDGGSAVGGDSEPFAVQVVNKGSREIKLERVELHYCAIVSVQTGGPTISKVLGPGQSMSVQMPPRGYLSALQEPMARSAEIFSSGVAMPFNFDRKSIRLMGTLAGVPVSLPVKSELTFLPDVEITNVSPRTVVLTTNGKVATASFSMDVRNNRSTPFNGRLAANLTQIGDYGSYHDAVLTTTPISLKPHETRKFRIEMPKSGATFKDHSWKGTLSHPYEADFRAQLETKGEPRWIDVGISNAVRVDAVPVNVAANLLVGFIRGFDYSLPDALASLGVKTKELSVDEVKTADLSKFTSIIVDNRVYQSKPDLIGANQKLLDFANAGGNLIVFYHQTDEFNPNPQRNRPQLSPYKLMLGSERVTDENAPITFLEPGHPLLNSPNKLNQDDFRNWIQERGLYYPREWDPQFKALLQSNDPNEQPLKGGLLVADYGRGHYIYTSMVWYRQLRAGVPGAYRMLANMISYGRAS